MSFLSCQLLLLTATLNCLTGWPSYTQIICHRFPLRVKNQGSVIGCLLLRRLNCSMSHHQIIHLGWREREKRRLDSGKTIGGREKERFPINLLVWVDKMDLSILCPFALFFLKHYTVARLHTYHCWLPLSSYIRFPPTVFPAFSLRSVRSCSLVTYTVWSHDPHPSTQEGCKTSRRVWTLRKLCI